MVTSQEKNREMGDASCFNNCELISGDGSGASTDARKAVIRVEVLMDGDRQPAAPLKRNNNKPLHRSV